MRSKYAYALALFVCAAAGFLFALLSHFTVFHGEVDLSGLVIVSAAIVVGSVGGTLSGLCAGAAYFIFAPSVAVAEIVAYAVVGLVLGVAYKYIFRTLPIAWRKIAACGVAVIIYFALRLISFLLLGFAADITVSAAITETAIFTVCALIVCLILPKDLRFFDEAKHE